MFERRKDEDYERKARAESGKAKIRIAAKVDRGELIAGKTLKMILIVSLRHGKKNRLHDRQSAPG